MDSSPRFRRTGSGSGSGRYPSMQVPVSDVPMHPSPNRTPSRGIARNSSSLDPYAEDNEGGGGSMTRMLSRTESTSVGRRASRFDSSCDDEEDHSDDSPGSDGGGEGQPAKMSLMALLAETDMEMGLDGSKYMMDDDDDFDQDTEEEEVHEKDKFSNCSVCMVKHHGDAFAVCGHTFCRLCSRELSIEKGHCPLCNNFVLEVLDVF